jgi:hypothetical protein
MRPDLRRWYEILLEESDGFSWCNLYLDLDLYKPANPQLDAAAFDALTRDLKALLREFMLAQLPWLSDADVRMVELSSSSHNKFSIHLIVHLRNGAFADFRHCGAFMRRFHLFLIERGGAPERNRFFGWGEKTVFPAPSGAELGELLKNGDLTTRNNWKSIVDVHVYTVHRAFRCYGSHKEGHDPQTRKLWLSAEAERRCRTDWLSDEGARLDRASFLDSMIQYFDPQSPPAYVITCTEPDGAEPTGSSNGWAHIYGDLYSAKRSGSSSLSTTPFKRRASSSSASSQENLEAALSQYLSQENENASVAALGYEPSTGIFTFKSGSHRCRLAQRDHSSNHVYYVVNIQRSVWYQKCPCSRGRSSASVDLPATLGAMARRFLTSDMVDVSAAFEFLKHLN